MKVLGSAQDGGYPQSGCYENCCKDAWLDNQDKRMVASIALIDPIRKYFWLIDISPDIKEQLYFVGPKYTLKGIFLTHAHIGHYIGLLELGKEVMDLKNIPVYAMPKMNLFLEKNAPINFLIENNNIVTTEIDSQLQINLNKNLYIEPFLVPHRNELSETVGYKVKSTEKSIIYLPDIDSWDAWKTNIIELIKENDILFLDGTFYDKSEIVNRDIHDIPHPSILESLDKLKSLDNNNRKKIYFTHLNHTNNLLRNKSDEYNYINSLGYNVAVDNMEIIL